jgi:hypothetical protein
VRWSARRACNGWRIVGEKVVKVIGVEFIGFDGAKILAKIPTVGERIVDFLVPAIEVQFRLILCLEDALTLVTAVSVPFPNIDFAFFRRGPFFAILSGLSLLRGFLFLAALIPKGAFCEKCLPRFRRMRSALEMHKQSEVRRGSHNLLSDALSSGVFVRKVLISCSWWGKGARRATSPSDIAA